MATPNAAGGRGGGRPCLRTRRDLFGAVLRTHVEPQDQSVPTATQVPVHRGKGSERAFPPPLPPSRKWFAPDILIGSSLPFERRAAQVARRPFNFGSEGERGGSVSRPAPPRPFTLAASARIPSCSAWAFRWKRHYLGSRGWFLVLSLQLTRCMSPGKCLSLSVLLTAQ